MYNLLPKKESEFTVQKIKKSDVYGIFPKD